MTSATIATAIAMNTRDFMVMTPPKAAPSYHRESPDEGDVGLDRLAGRAGLVGRDPGVGVSEGDAEQDDIGLGDRQARPQRRRIGGHRGHGAVLDPERGR